MNGEARVLGDLVARGRRSEAPALRAPASGREYDYRRLCTNAWKVGNFLRHLGVRGGCGVAVAAEPTPEPVLALFGAALLGGVTRYDRWSLSPGEAVAVRAPLTHPGTVAAGVVAPLLEGGVVVLAGDGPTTADRAVVAGAGPDDPDPPESRVLAPGSLLE